MARATQQFVYQLPSPVEVNSVRSSCDRISEVVVFPHPAGWVAVLLGSHVARSEVRGVTGWETRERVTRPVGFVQREGDRMPQDFVLAALRGAQAAGVAVSVPSSEPGAA